ncbi:hypothetical protein D1007_44100 [Hordeum vulgare]|nr:hypothetical protein D1007_44100 [Hordeum vulgare]
MMELRGLSSPSSTPPAVTTPRASLPPMSSPSFEGTRAVVQPSWSSSASLRPSTPPLRGAMNVAAAYFTPSPLRLSGRHSVGVDGAAATYEDSLTKVMRRMASRNLNFEGTRSHKSFPSFDNSKVSSNIASLGVSLGRNEKEGTPAIVKYLTIRDLSKCTRTVEVN